jgi:hypothetical protein
MTKRPFPMLRSLAALLLLAATPLAGRAQPAGTSAGAPMPGFGVMVHYLPDKQSINEIKRSTSRPSRRRWPTCARRT